MNGPNRWHPVHSGRRWNVRLVSVICLVVITQCGPQQPPTPVEILSIGSCPTKEGESDWIRLPVPNSVFRPGSIVSAAECSARWLGHIEDCDVPPDVLKVQFGYIGDWTQQTSKSYSAHALLDVPGISMGPEFKLVDRVEITEEGMGTESLNVIMLEGWLADERHELNTTCRRRLRHPDTFVIGESVRLSSAKYKLYNEAGVQMDGPKAARVISIAEANVTTRIQRNGELVLSVPVYTHIRNLQPSWDIDTVSPVRGPAGLFPSSDEREPAASMQTGDEIFLAITSGQPRKNIR